MAAPSASAPYHTLHLVFRRQRRKLLPFPPGPPRWPIFGNALSMPLEYIHVFFKDLGKRLGTKIIYLEALGQPMIVLNDAAIAQELLEKRSAVYSSRPELPMLTDVAGFRGFFSTMQYGQEWRSHRRMFQQYFSETRLHVFEERGLDFVRKGLLPNLYEDPQGLKAHMHNFLGGLSTSITYGLPIQRRNDPYVHHFEKTLASTTAISSPGGYLVNIIPLLKYIPEWFPGATFKKVAREVYGELLEMRDDPYNKCNAGVAPGSFVDTALDRLAHRDDRDDDGLHILHIKQTAATVYVALAETSMAASMTFVLAMLKYPAVQSKLQRELDSVIGSDRLPDFADLPQLIYLAAVVKEVLRWNPVAPTGVPHLTTEDDIYEGFYIPRNCIIFANAFAMLHDEDIFPDPKEFIPERFLKNDRELRDDLPNPERFASFGFGRRICPGRHIAVSMLYITIASVLHLFDINPSLDHEGKPVEVKAEFLGDSIVSNPAPFKCEISPRKGKDVQGLLQEYFGNEPI
ncbi:hypothetical protein NP233_g6373 [Leucocoprinus birnbaumii]|uniref:Cytochrome P450 n=1 Tax=Leucocoprinus birnbaumii TaxID=56174 RepID=A0AAD5YVL3_9AGAR|nr:hypothetical protein NP233_g6373 [Leucocoprinus birnbaumii]